MIMTPDVPLKLNNKTLFIGFFQIGIMGFGGVLAIARRSIVDDRKWLTAAEFSELFSLCQFMPGANITNFAISLGARHGGVGGALSALAGLLAAPIIIVMAMGALFEQFATVPVVQHAVSGMAAAAAGLIAATAMKIALPAVKQFRPALVTALAVGLVIAFHISLPVTMLILLPVSVALAWRA